MVESMAGQGMALAEFGTTAAGSAFITSEPIAADVAAAAGLSDRLKEVLAVDPGATVVALGQWSAEGIGDGGSVQHVELDITVSPTTDPDSIMQISIFELDTIAGGFDELTFGIEVLGEAYGSERVFFDVASANAFFASMISIEMAFGSDEVSLSDLDIRVYFDIISSAGQSIAYGLAAVVVPEPSTGLLLLIGLGLIGRRRWAWAAYRYF